MAGLAPLASESSSTRASVATMPKNGARTTARTFVFFGARQVFFLATQESAFSYGTFLDCGFVLDNLMLGLASLGLGSCPQFSAMAYPDLLKKHITGSEGALFIAGLPFGRPKPGSHVNAFQPSGCRSMSGSRSWSRRGGRSMPGHLIIPHVSATGIKTLPRTWPGRRIRTSRTTCCSDLRRAQQ